MGDDIFSRLRNKNNSEALRRIFDAAKKDGAVHHTNLSTSTSDVFTVGIEINNGDISISSPTMRSYGLQVSRLMADKSKPACINRLMLDANNFQNVKKRDIELKKELLNDMADDFSAFSGTGYRIKDDLVKRHKAVYGCEPRLFGDGSVLSNHVAVGPDIKPVGGDGKRSAMFYAGSDGTPLPDVMDYCQLRNMHMLFGTEYNGSNSNGDTYICFTEPDALVRDVNGHKSDILASWAEWQMSMGKDMMNNEYFLDDNAVHVEHPEDNMTLSDKCRKAVETACADGSTVKFTGFTAVRKPSDFEVTADNGDVHINMLTYGEKSLDKPVVFTSPKSDVSCLINRFNEVMTYDAAVGEAIRDGYECNLGSDMLGIPAEPAVSQQRDLSYKLGKDSHGRVKFRGTAMIDGKPTEVTVNRKYGEHEFDDAEIKQLLAGEEITISGFKTKAGTVQDVTGRLGTQQYQGRSFIGFMRTDLQTHRSVQFNPMPDEVQSDYQA